MMLFDCGLLLLRATGVPGFQQTIVVIEGFQPKSKLEAGARQDLLERGDAGLALAAVGGIFAMGRSAAPPF